MGKKNRGADGEGDVGARNEEGVDAVRLIAEEAARACGLEPNRGSQTHDGEVEVARSLADRDSDVRQGPLVDQMYKTEDDGSGEEIEDRNEWLARSCEDTR